MFGSMPSPRRVGGRHLAVVSLRRPGRVTDRDIAIEVGCRETKRFWRRVSEVCNRRRDDVAAPAVFNRHRNVERHAQVADLPRTGLRPPTFEIFRLITSIAPVMVAAQQGIDVGDEFIEDERQRGPLANGEAVFVALAGLLDVDIAVAHGIHDAHRIIDAPPCVGICDENLVRRQHIGNRMNAFDIVPGLAADFQLEARVAVCAMRRDVLGHLVRGSLANRPI